MPSVPASDDTGAPSVLVPAAWSPAYSAATDADVRRTLADLDADDPNGSDVVVTVGLGPLTAAARLTSRLRLVHLVTGATGTPEDAEAMRLLAPRLSRIVTVTRESAAWLEELLAGSGPAVDVIAPPLPEDPGFRPRSTLETRLVTTLEHQDSRGALRRLVNAFGAVAEEMPGWRLRIVGAGGGRIDLQRTVRKAGLFDRVELVAAPVGSMAEEWATASVAVHVDHSDRLPLDVHESQAAGVPALAYDTTAGAADLVTHERTGLLVAAGSLAGTSSALLRLATDAELRHRLGGNAAADARDRRDDDAARQWEELLAGSAAPATAAPARPVTALRTPAQARHDALRVALRAADQVTARWFVIPPAAGTDTVVVVPMRDQAPFLTALAAQRTDLSLVRPEGLDRPASRGTAADQAARFQNARLPQLRLEPWPGDPERPGLLAQGCGIDLEFWDETPQGDLRSHRPNRYATAVPPETEFVPVTVEGVECRTVELMTRPTAYDCRFPVDLVYTWVDGGDPTWAESRRRTLDALSGTETSREASGLARFTDRDELRYSMRSVHLFAPWVRRIHLVTAGQRPDWLVDHPMIRLIDHREILPDSALPTFNSHAIESALHRVPDLAEHWVYLNDDVFFGRPLTPEHFFTPSGQPYAFPDVIGLSDPSLSLTDEPWRKAAWNNRALLEESFGVINPTPMRHTPHPQRRSILEELEARYGAAFEQTRQAPFRSDTDISPLSSLAQHYGLITGRAVVGELAEEFVNISAGNVVQRLRHLLTRENDAFCLADHHDHALTPGRLEARLAEFFEEYYPLAAPWERT